MKWSVESAIGLMLSHANLCHDGRQAGRALKMDGTTLRSISDMQRPTDNINEVVSSQEMLAELSGDNQQPT